MRAADLHRRLDALASRFPSLPAHGLNSMTTGETRARLCDLLQITPEDLAAVGSELPALLRSEFEHRAAPKSKGASAP